MTLELQNIGMIKEAKVNIDGLTVIAGENDTGKSTVGKALFYIHILQDEINNSTKKTINYIDKFKNLNKRVNKLTKKDQNILSKYETFNVNNSELQTKFQKLKKEFIESYKERKDKTNELEANIQTIIQQYEQKLQNLPQELQEKVFYFQLSSISQVSLIEKQESKVIFIDTPILANFFDFFSMLATVQNEIEYEINNYPYLSKSLYNQLRLQLKKETTLDKYLQINILKEIIGGELKTNSMGDLVFVKNDGSTYPVNAVATGIKNFGILQLLLKNNYLTKDAILIVDEPEVHLHPKWQLKYAEFVVNLVQNGVKVFINSHSPYMIEALQRYSERANVPSDFYLAEDGYISKVEDSNSQTLSRIFKKLSEPFDVFDEMDSESLQNG